MKDSTELLEGIKDRHCLRTDLDCPFKLADENPQKDIHTRNSLPRSAWAALVPENRRFSDKASHTQVR